MAEEVVNKVEPPENVRELLIEFSVAYFLDSPSDIIDYAYNYFTKLKEERATLAKAKGDPNSRDDSSDDDVPVVNYNRRKSVFGEAYNPENDSDEENDRMPIFPKSDEQRARLAESVKDVLLFRSIERDQMHQILDAMFERKVQPGDIIIRQGDDGDNFYVIESGVYKVLKDDVQVHTYNNSGIFGELALMYNMPRSATVEAETEGLLWAMDRQTFRRILLKSAFKKRKVHEELLDSVPMLKTMSPYERMNLADALVTKHYAHGERIIKQGEEADGMYFVEKGKVSIRMEQNAGEVEIATVSKGAYFGELALLTNRPRAASAYAVGEVKLAFLETAAFERILGYLSEVLQRNIKGYEERLKTLAISHSLS